MPRNPAPAKGRQPPVPQERRNEIIEECKTQILDGWTMQEMADHHGISKVTLHLWFHALGDEYKALRQTWIDNLLVESGEKLEDESGDALSLARARELFKRATWYAERRDPFRYGAKGEGIQGPQINVYINRDGAMIDVTPGNPTPLVDLKRED